jgi:molybdate-binding protein/DNA-binding PadR family transcriptional regulator
VSIPHVILGLLAEGERHGYEMRRELGAVDPAWRLEYGQLYRLLAKLERESLVVAREEASCGGPNRRCYRLTEEGRAELERWLAEPEASLRPARDELPLKLIANEALGREPTAALIEERRRELLRQRAIASKDSQRAQRCEELGRWLASETRLKHLDGSLAALESYEAKVSAQGSGAPASSIEAAGSDDPLLGLLARHLSRRDPPVTFTSRPIGSLAGLLALREGAVHLAGTHLIDVETGEYNVAFVKRLLIEEPVLLVNLSYREQGLMVRAEDRSRITGLEDLAKPGVNLVNRQQGAGTRLLLHAKLRQLDIAPTSIDGWEREVETHEQVAERVAKGEADVGMGIRAVARAWELDFVPLGRERYDLAMRRSDYESPRLGPLREALADDSFRSEVSQRPGYDISDMGVVMAQID